MASEPPPWVDDGLGLANNAPEGFGASWPRRLLAKNRSACGGKGTDTLSYVNADRGVKVTMGSGTQLGHTEADFVTLSFFNPLTGQYVKNVETKTVTQFKGIENVTGSNFADTITGNSAENRIDAGAGMDTINGGGGADTIISGREADQIWGGEGPDTFVFNHFLDSTQFNALSSVVTSASAVAGVDVINDFLVGSDKIDLSGIDANSTISGNQAFEFVDGDEFDRPSSEFTGQAGEVRLVEFFRPPSPDTQGFFYTSVVADIDGDGQRDFTLQVISAVPMTVNDFIL
jgi:Ca2+-binding RTX toxin-like protein